MKKYTDEELLNAAQMIKEHCRSGGVGHFCCFAIDGKCASEACCGIAAYGTTPADDWKIPKLRRWTDTDVTMAKACVKLGYITVELSPFPERWPQVRKGDTVWILNEHLFQSLEFGEIVSLSDIIEVSKEEHHE